MTSLDPCFSTGLHWCNRDHWYFYLCPSLCAKVGGRPGFPKCLARVSTADPVSLCVSQSLDLEQRNRKSILASDLSYIIQRSFNKNEAGILTLITFLYSFIIWFKIKKARVEIIISCGSQYKAIMNIAYSRWVKVKGTIQRNGWPARGLVAEKNVSDELG